MSDYSRTINDIQLSEHFKLREFQCRCCRRVMISPALLWRLEELRNLLKTPVIVTSGYRCPSHNEAVGGVKNSLHTFGRAADIAIKRELQSKTAELARRCGFASVIPYADRGFIHLGVD